MVKHIKYPVLFKDNNIKESDNLDFKNDLEKKYPNVKCELSLKNLGMGSGNILGIKFI